MACGGFTCSKNALCALNFLYILVGILLIGVSVYSRASNTIPSIAVISGIIACGVFLMIVAVVGLVGAIKHHQVLLFFYMIILFLLFLVQFILACACLAVNEDQQHTLLLKGWESASNSSKLAVQSQFNCCGFDRQTLNVSAGEGPGAADFHPPCGTDASRKAQCCIDNDNAAACCSGVYRNDSSSLSPQCPCHKCYDKLQDVVDKSLHVSGGIGLFFSFTEFVGVWLTVRYRNQKDPRANPSAFL